MGLSDKIKKIKTFINPQKISVNCKEYIIDDSLELKIQHTSADLKPYGWAVESRTNYNGQWSEWYNHWNHRIYNSKSVAMDACIKLKNYQSSNYEYRIIPLYKLDNDYHRQCKLDRIFNDNEIVPKKYELKAWKLKDDYEWHKTQNHTIVFTKNTVFIQLENGTIIKKSNAVDPTCHYIDKVKLLKLVESGLAEEIELKDEKWLHPHLLKTIKEKIKL